jgi:hypothetical protein
MRIDMTVAHGRFRAMEASLAQRLRAMGHVVRFVSTPAGQGDAPGLGLLARLENMLYGPLPRDLRATAPLEANGFDGAADLTIDLVGATSSAPALFVTFDGARGEAAALAALLDRRAPTLAIVARMADGATRLCEQAWPAIEHPHRATEGLNRILGRSIDLLARAVQRWNEGSDLPPARVLEAKNPGALAPPAFAAARLAAKIAARLQRLAGGAEASHWRVAWRRASNDLTRETFAWPGGDYLNLPDDGARYYADPFLFTREGKTYLFVEEFPYATQRGIISVCEIGADGVAGAPRPVLELSCHLSYPLVFERDGVIYMMPESAAGGGLDLYRAERFPDVWVKERALLDGVPVADATLLQRDGRFWLFASPQERGQSDWDTLSLFHADDLGGPWTPEGDNPVLIDCRQARGAGHFFTRDGRLYRPVQDCSRGYGSALAICEIETLEPGKFAQRIAARLPPPAGGPGGVHTLNDAGGIEAIDLLGTPGDARKPTTNMRSSG